MADEIPKLYEPAPHERRVTERWLEADAFAAVPDRRDRRYVIMMPLPNVTGALHMGHAMDNVMQDLLIRWRRMAGDNTLWMPGTDHAGIATQAVVEKRLFELEGKTRHDLGRGALVARIWAWKDEYQARIIRQQQRMGCSCDWKRQRFTMDAVCARAVREAFFRLFADGLICRGDRLVNWDCQLQTAVSDDEIVHEKVQGHFWHIRYPVIEPRAGEPEFVVVATTRPETMLGDTAVAVHPDPAAELERRIAETAAKIASAPKKDRAELEQTLENLESRRRDVLPLLLRLRDMAHDGRRLRLPLLDRPLPLIVDSWADPALGTGCVKITPAHDPNDYGVWERHKDEIGIINILNPDGTLNASAGPFAGADRFDARRRVVADLKARDLLESVEDREMEVGHSDRSKTPIEPYLSKQWFVRMGDADGGIVCGAGTPNEFRASGLAQAAIDASRPGYESPTGRRLTFAPDDDRYGGTYRAWLGEKRDWCISRQLWWGHQIPVWYGLDLALPAFTDDERDGALDEVELFTLLAEGMVHADELTHAGAGFDAVAERFRDDIAALPTPLEAMRIVEVADREAAIDAFAAALADYNVTQDPTRLVYPVWRDPDVLDTWFSSGLWPIGTLGWPERTEELARYFPTSVLVTGFDILFFWVARMMMMQLAVVGQVPFRDVYVHGLVRDEKGAKMSKSKGNVVDPLSLIDEYGADALRFTLTQMAAMGRDPKLGPKHVEGGRNFVTKLWNATRFAQLNGVTGGGARPAPLHAINRWIMGELSRTISEVDVALEAFRFNDAAGTLYAFTWGKLCDWYVEAAKPLFDGEAADETRAVMGWVLDRTFALLHPFMPFVTEELWSLTGERAAMLAVSPWPEAEPIDAEADREVNWVIALIEAIRSARAQLGVPVGAKLDLVVTEADAPARAALAAESALVERLARVNAPREGAAGRGMIAVSAPGASFALPVGEVIDVATETARLEKQAARGSKDAEGLRKRLANPRFIENAEAEVVEETRAKLAALDDEIARTRAALAQLAAL